MKEYRRRFIALSLSLTAAVLLAVFVGIGIFVYRNTQRELQMTMRQVLAPLEGMPWAQHRDPAPDSMPRQEDSITVVFCSVEIGSHTVLSNRAGLSEEQIGRLVSAVSSLEEDSGSVPGAGMLYYRESTDDTVKLAFLPSSLLYSSMVRLFWTLLIIFIAALVLFYLICRYISGLAVQPLEKAMARETQFVTDISHDLKTPLTVILANSSILRQSPQKQVGEQMNWIESTEDAARTMLSMVDDMLTISSVADNGGSTRTEDLDLSSLAEKTCLQLDSVAYERGLLLQEDLAPGLRVRGRTDYLSRILSCLIENALKYEASGGTVSASLRQKGSSAVFSVRNSAVIPAEDLPHLFERFYRVDKARTSHSGFGLGLAIAKQMTESLGGTISVKSSAEAGTVFQVSFPLAD